MAHTLATVGITITVVVAVLVIIVFVLVAAQAVTAQRDSQLYSPATR